MALIASVAAFTFALARDLDVPALNVEPVETGLGLLVDAVPFPDDPKAMLLATLDGYLHRWHAETGPVAVLHVPGVTAMYGEQGLYSAVFHPDWPRDDRVFIAHTSRGTGDLILVEHALPPSGAIRGDAHRELLRIPIPQPLHHGGMLRFGGDGLLYFAVGNGISAIELLRERPYPSQDPDSLRGKILRLDVEDPDGTLEVFASGFRNPWKFTIMDDGRLVVADVGEDTWEEITVATRGSNHGWPLREGPACFRDPFTGRVFNPVCLGRGFTDPVISYRHIKVDPEGGQSVTGGVVISEAAGETLAGYYVFGDFISGRIWLARPGPVGAEHWDYGLAAWEPGAGLAAFVETGDGQLYGIGLTGTIYRLAAAAASDGVGAP